jgi:hypothetical protein
MNFGILHNTMDRLAHEVDIVEHQDETLYVGHRQTAKLKIVNLMSNEFYAITIYVVIYIHNCKIP